MEVRYIRTLEELDRVFTLLHSLLGTNLQNHPRDLQFYKNVFKLHPEILVIALEEEQIIGGALGSIDGNNLLLGEMAVDVQFRRHHVGSRLLQYLEQMAKGIGILKVLLGALPEAEQFYLKNGYSPMLFLMAPKLQQEVLDSFLLEYTPTIPVVFREDEGDMIKRTLHVESLDHTLQKQFEAYIPRCLTQYLFEKVLYAA